MFAWTRRWPRVAIGVLVFVFLTSALSFGRIVHALRAKPNPTIDSIALANALLAAETPPGANAWETVRSIIVDDLGVGASAPVTTDWLSRFDTARRHNEYAWLEAGAWEDADRSEAVALLDDIRPLLAPLARTLEEPAFAIPITHAGDGLTGELDTQARRSITQAWFNQTEFAWLRRFPEVLGRMLRIDAQRGDWDSFLTNTRVVLRLSDGTMRGTTVYHTLVGYGNISATAREIAHALNEHDLPPTVLAALLSTIEEAAARFADAESLLIRAEMLDIRDLVQWTFTDDGAGDGRFIPAEFHREVGALSAPNRITDVILNLLGGAVSRRQTLSTIDEAERRLHALIGAPPEQLITGADQFTRWWRTQSGFTSEAPLAEQALPWIASTSTRLAGVRLMLLIELHRARTGRTPANLEEAATPEDTIDPVSGRSFIYTPTPGDPHGRRYTLRMPWSVPDDWRGDEINPPREKHWSQRGPDDWP